MDQPIGTGFSYSTDRRDIRHNEDGVSNDLYDFLQVILFHSLNKFPEKEIILDTHFWPY